MYFLRIVLQKPRDDSIILYRNESTCDAAALCYAEVVAYLALGPGLVGHTGYNGVLRYVSPLVVSISLTMEPLFGSLLGWAMAGSSVYSPFYSFVGLFLPT